MIKKFAEGLVFGAGFAIAFTVIGFAANLWVATALMTSKFSSIDTEIVARPGEDLASIASRMGYKGDSGVPFHELGVDEQIKTSSVIALAAFESTADGRMRAVITEFFKNDPGTKIHYAVGDEYHPASYYPNVGTSHGDGVVIFFVGSPASMRMSMSYSGDRIRGLGDLPLRLFKEKCAKPDDAAANSQ